MTFDEAIDLTAKIVDAIGVAIILLGALTALVTYTVKALKKTDRISAFRITRQQMGRSILLGLEFLIAGDIIRTVATSPTFQNVGVLALIVLIRTFLSLTLQLEVERRWPWEKDSPTASAPR